ncbi:MAG TPA: hypothetical protein VFN97_24505 [Actinospica sp.]|nr:hypothetical protein [Actinospica sp.]
MTVPNARRAVVLHLPDAFANGEKPRRIKEFLESHGYAVDLHPTGSLSRLGTGGLAGRLPGATPSALLAYVLEAVFAVCLGRRGKAARRAVALSQARLIPVRGRLLERRLRGRGYDLLICESNLDQGIMLRERVAAVQVLDLPAPYAEELYHGGHIDEAGLNRLRAVEKQTYARADHLAFHWHTYREFVRTTKYDGPNLLGLGYGAPVPTTSARARFSETPRIVFLGYLSGYWVNLPLLEQLCSLYPHIDLYGGPAPTGPLAAHYKGYSPDADGRSGKDVLADYQFGLVTITDDELRRHSFSSKHLDYISYGLPVLTPAWRRDSVLDASSVHYTPETFLDRLGELAAEPAWRARSEAALKTAAELSWDAALSPLLGLPRNAAKPDGPSPKRT